MNKKIRLSAINGYICRGIIIGLMVCAATALQAQDGGEKSAEDTGKKIFNNITSAKEEERKASISYIQKNTPPEFLPLLVKAIIDNDKSAQRQNYIDVLKLYPSESAVDSWVEILEKTRSFILKQEVIEHVSTLNDRRAVLPIARELYSPFRTVRRSAAMALQKSGDDRVYPFIIEMAGSDSPVKRIYAVEALYFLYDMRFQQILMGLLEDENKSVRIYALHCVLENGMKKAVSVIRKSALDDSDDEVRINAIMVLGEFQDTGALYVLLKTLSDANRDVRLESVRSLYKFALSGSAYAVSSRLLDEDDDEIKDLIIETLLRVKKTGNPAALRKVLLEDKNVRMRIKTAWILGVLKEERNMQILMEGLEDGDYRVRAEVCSSLGKYRSRIMINRLIDIVKNDKIRYVRCSALYALGYMNFRESIVPLFDLYSTEQEIIFKELLRGVIRQLMKNYL